jgi:hypothetical protein
VCFINNTHILLVFAYKVQMLLCTRQSDSIETSVDLCSSVFIFGVGGFHRREVTSELNSQ